MTVRQSLIDRATETRHQLTALLSFLGSPAFYACSQPERELRLELATMLHALEGVYINLAELADPVQQLLPAGADSGAELLARDASTWDAQCRASNVCPVCKGSGKDPRSMSGVCRRCNGSGRYVRSGA